MTAPEAKSAAPPQPKTPASGGPSALCADVLGAARTPRSRKPLSQSSPAGPSQAHRQKPRPRRAGRKPASCVQRGTVNPSVRPTCHRRPPWSCPAPSQTTPHPRLLRLPCRARRQPPTRPPNTSPSEAPPAHPASPPQRARRHPPRVRPPGRGETRARRAPADDAVRSRVPPRRPRPPSARPSLPNL